MNNLGWMYEGGLGVSKDPGMAKRLYLNAAALGNKIAQKNLDRIVQVELDNLNKRRRAECDHAEAFCAREVAEMGKRCNWLLPTDGDADRAHEWQECEYNIERERERCAGKAEQVCARVQ
jgi:TPR repeat protein